VLVGAETIAGGNDPLDVSVNTSELVFFPFQLSVLSSFTH
jgi:hypothetical protein